MSALFPWIMAASALLAPSREHGRLAEAIASRVEAAPPLFKGDDDRRRTSALLVAIAFRESSLRADAVGDHRGGKPTSFCAFQINLPWGAKTAEGWTGEDLIADPAKCVAAAMTMLRISMRVCPAFAARVVRGGSHGVRVGARREDQPRSNGHRRASRSRRARSSRRGTGGPQPAPGDRGILTWSARAARGTLLRRPACLRVDVGRFRWGVAVATRSYGALQSEGWAPRWVDAASGAWHR